MVYLLIPHFVSRNRRSHFLSFQIYTTLPASSQGWSKYLWAVKSFHRICDLSSRGEDKSPSGFLWDNHVFSSPAHEKLSHTMQLQKELTNTTRGRRLKNHCSRSTAFWGLLLERQTASLAAQPLRPSLWYKDGYF